MTPWLEPTIGDIVHCYRPGRARRVGVVSGMPGEDERQDQYSVYLPQEDRTDKFIVLPIGHEPILSVKCAIWPSWRVREERDSRAYMTRCDAMAKHWHA